jgi:hypothetical protein
MYQFSIFFGAGYEYDYVFDWTVMRLQKLNKMSQTQPKPQAQPRFSVSFLSFTPSHF